MPSRLVGFSRAARLIAGCLSLVVFLGATRASAQFTVELSLPRRTFMFYEPIIATVTLTNLSGRDVTFEDIGGKQWFNVEVTTLDGEVLQPYDPNYHLQPMTILSGQTLRRKIDLNPLFPIREPGSHRLRANVYFAQADKFFASRYVTIDMAEGQLLWKQDVGVPGSTETHEFELLTFQRPDRLLLYVRVRDSEGLSVYGCDSLGRLVANGTIPLMQLDRENTLHVLHEAAPGAYLYTQIGVNGEWLNQQAYAKKGTTRPSLVKTVNGEVEIHGGELQIKEPTTAGNAPVREPKLSDRPATLPGQKKPTP